VNTQKKTYRQPAIREIGNVSELTQAVNVLGGGDVQFSLLRTS
jgi:hypothetical protein